MHCRPRCGGPILRQNPGQWNWGLVSALWWPTAGASTRMIGENDTAAMGQSLFNIAHFMNYCAGGKGSVAAVWRCAPPRALVTGLRRRDIQMDVKKGLQERHRSWRQTPAG